MSALAASSLCLTPDPPLLQSDNREASVAGHKRASGKRARSGPTSRLLGNNCCDQRLRSEALTRPRDPIPGRHLAAHGSPANPPPRDCRAYFFHVVVASTRSRHPLTHATAKVFIPQRPSSKAKGKPGNRRDVHLVPEACARRSGSGEKWRGRNTAKVFIPQ